MTTPTDLYSRPRPLWVLAVVALVSTVGLGCAREPATPVVSCEDPLPAIDWGDSGIPEAFAEIEEELATTDLSGLSDPIDISAFLPLYRGFIAYALGIPPAELGDSLAHAQAEAAGSLGDVVLAAIARADPPAVGMDITFFRRGFHRYYTCSRGYPLSLEGFYLTFVDFRETEGRLVNSVAKCGDRNLILDSAAQVYVAETLVNGQVRETEILLADNRDDGQLDFLVYDSDGMLTERSLFPVASGAEVVAAAPYSCMSCHVDPGDSTTWSFDLLVPETGPCASPL
jgi:hypothetical protein